MKRTPQNTHTVSKRKRRVRPTMHAPRFGYSEHTFDSASIVESDTVIVTDRASTYRPIYRQFETLDDALSHMERLVARESVHHPDYWLVPAGTRWPRRPITEQTLKAIGCELLLEGEQNDD